MRKFPYFQVHHFLSDNFLFNKVVNYFPYYLIYLLIALFKDILYYI